VLDAIDRHTTKPVKRVMEGRRPGDPAELVAGNARLLRTLSWAPRYADIDRIVGDALAWERTLLERSAEPTG
jgi:UDP-glucose 4-epimerase